MSLSLRALHLDGWAVLDVDGDLGPEAAAQLAAAVAELASTSSTPAVAVDLRRVSGPDGSTGAALQAAHTDLAAGGRRLVVVSGDPAVLAWLRGLTDPDLDVAESLDDALGDHEPVVRTAQERVADETGTVLPFGSATDAAAWELGPDQRG